MPGSGRHGGARESLKLHESHKLMCRAATGTAAPGQRRRCPQACPKFDSPASCLAPRCCSPPSSTAAAARPVPSSHARPPHPSASYPKHTNLTTDPTPISCRGHCYPRPPPLFRQLSRGKSHATQNTGSYPDFWFLTPPMVCWQFKKWLKMRSTEKVSQL